jgi:hypothetical protein
VQKGKFADCAFAFDRQLNRVDLPTFGSPTIPHCKAIYIVFNNFDRVTKVQKYAIRRPTFSEELSPRRHPRDGNPADSAPERRDIPEKSLLLYFKELLLHHT